LSDLPSNSALLLALAQDIISGQPGQLGQLAGQLQGQLSGQLQAMFLDWTDQRRRAREEVLARPPVQVEVYGVAGWLCELQAERGESIGAMKIQIAEALGKREWLMTCCHCMLVLEDTIMYCEHKLGSYLSPEVSHARVTLVMRPARMTQAMQVMQAALETGEALFCSTEQDGGQYRHIISSRPHHFRARGARMILEVTTWAAQWPFDGEMLMTILDSMPDQILQWPPALQSSQLLAFVVGRNPLLLDLLPDNCHSDRLVVLAAVKSHWKALQWASPDLQASDEVVMAAVEQNGQALQYASTSISRAVVLAAVSQCGQALRWASPEYQRDIEVILHALQQDGLALQWVSPDLWQHDEDSHDHRQHDEECAFIAAMAVQQTFMAIQFVPLHLHRHQRLLEVAFLCRPEIVRLTGCQ
jgi:Domain of unknown function (DUF4116)